MRIDEHGVIVLSLINLRDLWEGRIVTHPFTRDEDIGTLVDNIIGDAFISVRLEEGDIP